MERAAAAGHCIATVTDSGYLPGTEVLLSSFLRHNPWFEGEIVVLHDGLSAGARRRLAHLPRLRFRRVGAGLRTRLRELAVHYPRIRPRLARFHSLEAFSLTGYEWVLFLDGDILCTGDVRGLLHPPNAEPPLVACPDQTRFRDQVRDADTLIPVPREAASASRDLLADCFNTGVMVIRSHRLDPETPRRLLAGLDPERWSGIRTGHTDQAVLNRHFGASWVTAPERYNYLLAPDSDRWERCSMEEAVLLHFLGMPKPWHVLRSVPPPAPGDQRSRGWRLWAREARRNAMRRLLATGDPRPLGRLAAAAGRRLAARGRRTLRPPRTG